MNAGGPLPPPTPDVSAAVEPARHAVSAAKTSLQQAQQQAQDATGQVASTVAQAQQLLTDWN